MRLSPWKTRPRHALSLCAALLIVAPVAGLAEAPRGAGDGKAQTEPGQRQTGSLTFTERRPGRSSEVVLTADYINPGAPHGKPPAVRRTVVTLPEGTVVDTSAPGICAASDQELMAEGHSACPPESLVGRGFLLIDSGFPEPGRYFPVDVTLLNNEDELIFLSRERGSGARVVARSRVEGRVIRNSVPKLPGTPPDGGAIDRQRLIRDSVSRQVDGQVRSYITTPPTCPESGFWVSTVEFIYDDGVVQTLHPRSPCEAAVPPSPSATCRGREATLVGTRHRERLIGTSGRDVIAAGFGNDRVRGRGGNDLICAGRGDDRLSGGRGRDRLVGQRGDDRLSGGRGRDRLVGQRGDDRLAGGRGTDRCVGGRHADRFSGCERRTR